jgi:hypothetical protein
MEEKTFTLNGVTFSYIDNMPDGDYTVGRGADPRGQGSPSGHIAVPLGKVVASNNEPAVRRKIVPSGRTVKPKVTAR